MLFPHPPPRCAPRRTSVGALAARSEEEGDFPTSSDPLFPNIVEPFEAADLLKESHDVGKQTLSRSKEVIQGGVRRRCMVTFEYA